MSKAIVKKEMNAVGVDLTIVRKIESIVEMGLSVRDATHIEKAFTTAKSVQRLVQMLDEEIMKEYIMPMMNSKLGFKTDKDPNKNRKCNNLYSIPVVRDCVVDALLSGVNIVGNEFNIISDQMYITREGFAGKLKREYPNIWFDIISGIPKMVGEKGAIVEVEIQYREISEVEIKSLKRVIPVKMNSFMGTDGALGKAFRKAECALYNHLSGQVFSVGDADEMINITSQVKEEPPAKSVFEQAPQAQEVKAEVIEPMESQEEKFKARLKCGVTVDEIQEVCKIKEILFGFDRSPEYYINMVLNYRDENKAENKAGENNA